MAHGKYLTMETECRIEELLLTTSLPYESIADKCGVCAGSVHNVQVKTQARHKPVINFDMPSRDRGYLIIKPPSWFDSEAKRVYFHHVVYCYEHNLRCVPEGYVVHHKNHDPLDNRPENLELMKWGDHSKLHNSVLPRPVFKPVKRPA